MKSFIVLALALLSLAFRCHGFVSPLPNNHAAKSATQRQMTVLTYGNKKKDFKPGTPLKKAVAQLGIKPKYSCNK